jgi:hypothetical protein
MPAKHVRAFITMVCGSLLLTAGGRAAESALLICADPSYDFGTMVNTAIVQHVFTLRNAGGVTAVIARVHSPCSCTTLSLARMQIPPGESEPMTAQFDLKGRTGLQNRPLYVNYNSASIQPLRLALSGTALAEVSVEPNMVCLGLPASGHPTNQTVRIRSYVSNELFRVTGVTSSVPRFTAQVEERIPGQEYWLQVQDTQPELAGATNAVVTLSGAPGLKGPLSITVRKFATGRDE